MEPENTYIPVKMKDGTVIGIESASPVEHKEQPYDFNDVSDQIKDLAESIMMPIREISPRKAEVSFGIQIRTVNGNIITTVSEGTAKANFKITLEWN